MIVYGRDSSGLDIRKTNRKRTKPKYGDNFQPRVVVVPAYRVDGGKANKKSCHTKNSAIVAFLKNTPVVDMVVQVPARTQERNEVLQVRERIAWLAKDYD